MPLGAMLTRTSSRFITAIARINATSASDSAVGAAASFAGVEMGFAGRIPVFSFPLSLGAGAAAVAAAAPSMVALGAAILAGVLMVSDAAVGVDWVSL